LRWRRIHLVKRLNKCQGVLRAKTKKREWGGRKRKEKKFWGRVRGRYDTKIPPAPFAICDPNAYDVVVKNYCPKQLRLL